MEKRKLKTFINRQEKKSPNISRRAMGTEIWEGEEAEGRKAASSQGRLQGRGENPGEDTVKRVMPRSRGAGQSK